MHCSVCAEEWVSVCQCARLCVCVEPESDPSGVQLSAADTLHHTKKLKSELECEYRLSDK